MAKNDEVDQAKLGGPSVDIPDLKKKEKERKRGGAAWSGARAPGGTFQGAAGGAARSAASAASAAAGGAQAGAGLLARLAALSLMGKVAAAAAAFALVGGAGMVGSALLRGGGGAPAAGAGSPALGGIASTVKVRSGGRDRIGINSRGEIAFDPVAKAKPEAKKAEEAQPAADAPGASAADAAKEAAEAEAAKGKLAHDLSGAKLSGSLGGQFGGQNIFSGSGGAPKFGDNAAKFAAKGGKLAPLRAGGVRGRAGARGPARNSSGRAIGQLRVAKGQSVRGATASSAEEASAAAAGAFDPTTPTDGTLSTSEGATDTATTGASTSGSSSSSGGDVTVPETISLDDVQAALDQIKALIDQANQLKETGTMLIVLGLLLIALGAGPFTWWLIPIGTALCYAGYQQLEKAKELEEKAKAMGDALAARTGEFQSKVVRECVDQAIANGTSLDECRSLEAAEKENQVEAQTAEDLQTQKEIVEE